MTFTASSDSIRRTVAGLRWWIAAVLFASTVINYVDRQTLSLLAPYLKVQYHWSNTDYADIVIAFRVAYAIGQSLFGRLMDRIGTRRGLTFTVAWYSLVSVLTPLASGLYSFGLFRFLLGGGESANWPAATKAVSEWFPIYLVAKGIELRSGLLAVWVPFIAADLGNFFGGGFSGWLIKRGWSLGSARKAVVVFGGIGVLLLIPTIFTTNLYLITSLFATATFSYAAFSTIANVLPSDLYESGSVATVSGFGGTASGIGTIIAFKLIGHYSDLRQGTSTRVFDPIIVVAGLIPFVGMLLVLLLVRNTSATKQGLVREI